MKVYFLKNSAVLLFFWLIWSIYLFFSRWSWKPWLAWSTWGAFLGPTSWIQLCCGRLTIPPSSLQPCRITASLICCHICEWMTGRVSGKLLNVLSKFLEWFVLFFVLLWDFWLNWKFSLYISQFLNHLVERSLKSLPSKAFFIFFLSIVNFLPSFHVCDVENFSLKAGR